MRALMAVMVLVPQLVLAQDQQIDNRPYWSTCQQIWTRSPYVRVDAPLYFATGTFSGSSLPSGGGSSGGSGGSTSFGSGFSSGGGKGAEVLLVLAVVALAVLPFI